MRALNHLPDVSGHYGKQSFNEGLARCGITVVPSLPNPGPDDVLVIWNRNARDAIDAERFERAGARVLVVENGYLGKEWRGAQWYAMSVGHHNGAGRWPWRLGPERWLAWGVDMAPWRPLGGPVVVLAQRGIGEPAVRSPDSWHIAATQRVLRMQPSAKVRIRHHPGKNSRQDTIEAAVADASCVVTWGSGAAIKCLLLGIHVFYDLPQWIGAPAATPLSLFSVGSHGNDARRLAMFERLAWAMYTREEVTSGFAIRKVLEIG